MRLPSSSARETGHEIAKCQLALEELIERFNTEAQARFYLEHMGVPFEEYKDAHETYHSALLKLQAALPGHRTQTIERSYLPSFLFGPLDIAVTLGPDGLVINTAKYLDEGSQLIIPAKLSKAETKKVQQLAVQAFQAVDCTGLARVDFLMDPKTRKIYLNEINTMPGFTSISMYPKLWAASGLAYPELISRLIELGLERHADKKKNQYSR